jgi:hypothetical protein
MTVSRQPLPGQKPPVSRACDDCNMRTSVPRPDRPHRTARVPLHSSAAPQPCDAGRVRRPPRAPRRPVPGQRTPLNPRLHSSSAGSREGRLPGAVRRDGRRKLCRRVPDGRHVTQERSNPQRIAHAPRSSQEPNRPPPHPNGWRPVSFRPVEGGRWRHSWRLTTRNRIPVPALPVVNIGAARLLNGRHSVPLDVNVVDDPSESNVDHHDR